MTWIAFIVLYPATWLAFMSAMNNYDRNNYRPPISYEITEYNANYCDSIGDSAALQKHYELLQGKKCRYMGDDNDSVLLMVKK